MLPFATESRASNVGRCSISTRQPLAGFATRLLSGRDLDIIAKPCQHVCDIPNGNVAPTSCATRRLSNKLLSEDHTCRCKS